MCGIAGGSNLSTERLEKMLQCLRHRGPDALSFQQLNKFSLGSVRLSIIDREHGHQPFRSPCGKITAVCNGEIYNWQELRRKLEAAGHQFKTRCDCEILPAAWLEWREALPEKLNGMFAFAIHDATTNSLFLARDRCGQKPLYYSAKNSFVFASEIKAFPAAGIPLELTPANLSTWLSLRYLPEPETLFQNITILPAAHSMTVSASGEISIRRYWQAGQPEVTPTFSGSALDYLDQTTRSAVELALQADVPVATYLSGGVDSALLAHYMRDLGADANSISIGFGAASDETPAAQATAKHLGFQHHNTELTPDSFSRLSQVVTQMDRPVGDLLILAFDELARHTSSLGYKVALGGEGPDEHFAGYSFHKAYLTAQKIGPLGCKLAATTIDHLPSKILNHLAKFPAALGSEGRRKSAQYFRSFHSSTFFEKATRLHTLFEPEEINKLLHPDLIAQQRDHEITKSKEGPGDPMSELLALQYQHWLPDWSLIRQDKNTMAHSLEYRAPFLDHRLIDFALTHPKEALLHKPDKALWRALAARHLPHEMTHRPKQPFYLPLEHPRWRKALIVTAREVLAPENLRKHNWLSPKAIEPLFEAQNFLPLKKLGALVILQQWLNSVTSNS